MSASDSPSVISGHVPSTSARTDVPESDLADALHAIEDAAADVIWDIRHAKADGYLVWDADDVIIIGFPDAGTNPLDVTGIDRDVLDAAYACHTARANVYERDRGIPDARGKDQWLFLTPTEDTSWQHYLQTHCDWQMPFELQADFVCPKWNEYEKSISAWAEYPGWHGTLRKEVKVQAFPSHRMSSKDVVRMYTTLSHVETDTELESSTDENEIPSARSFDVYPHIPHIRRSVYDKLFDCLRRYTEIIADEFELCDRCGTYERPAENIYVDAAIDPDGGWEHQYCTECYARRLHDEYNVTQMVGRMYALQSAGFTTEQVGEKLDAKPEFIDRMVENLNEALQSTDGYTA